MWNVLEFSLHPVYASYKRRDEELVADAVRGATVVWNIRPVMLAAYALTTNIVYTIIAFITIFIIFAFCKCFTVNMRIARKTFL